MKTHFEILKVSRQHFVSMLNAFSNEQVNQIPTGFGNNIIWNIGHVLVSQQILHYTLSGVEPKISAELLEKYRKGAKGNIQASQEEVNLIKELLVQMPEQLEKDYENGLFTQYKQYPTSFKFVLNSIEDAIIFNNVHEGIHFGIIMSMKKHL